MVSRFFRGAARATGTTAVSSRAASRLVRIGAAAVLAAGLGACSAGPGSSLPASVSPAAGAAGMVTSDAAASGANLELRLLIPRPKRAPHFVSPSTQSIVVSQGSKKIHAFNTQPDAPGCKVGSGGTLCIFKTGLKPGRKQTITIATYDAQNGTGKLLSTGAVVVTIKKGLNIIPITLQGVVASISVALQDDDPPAGTPIHLGVTVTAYDADGNAIVGPGNYNVPVALSTSDTTGTVQLLQTSVTGPGQSVTLSYSGHSIDTALITATATGLAPSSALFDPAPTVISDFGVSSSARHRTSLHHGHAVSVQAPSAIVTGPDGNLYAAISNTIFGIVKMTTAGQTVALWKAGTPPSTFLPAQAITGLTFSGGNLWYVDANSVGFVDSGGHATDFPWTGSGLCPGPGGVRIAPAAAGGVWVSLQCASGSQLANISSTGVMKFSTIPNLTSVHDLIVGLDGNIYLAGEDQANSTAAVEQVFVSGGTVSFVNNPYDIPSLPNVFLVGIAQSPDGDIWATTGSCTPSAFVRVHSFGSTPDVFPTFGCSSPYYLKALPDGDLWAADFEYAGATRLTPGTYPAAPSEFDMLLPTPGGVSGSEWDVTLGPDGDLYYTDDSSTPTTSGDIAKVAY